MLASLQGFLILDTYNMSSKIKFGTDGWRAIIADDYTVQNVARVAQATADWIKANSKDHQMVLGHDSRFGGEMFAHTVVKIMAANNIKVFLSEGPVSTPMISMGANKTKSPIGVIITASHNPPSYNGYKLKAHHGGPLFMEQIQEVEDMIPDSVEIIEVDFEDLKANGKLEIIPLEDWYYDHVLANFDMEAINASGLGIAYDGMYGSGQDIMRRLFPNATLLHCNPNPSFMGQAPEPIERNLKEFQSLIREKGNIDFALATDGDADRIGLFDGNGNFVDAHHIILLLIHYLYKYKGMTGKVVTAFSVSVKIKKMCEAYGIELITTKIGFKYICKYMVEDDVLVGGEESGGIAVKGHIPERDGIWDGLVILELMAKSGKTISELIEEIYAVVGSFAYDRNDLHLKEEEKLQIIEDCKNGKFENFGSYQVEGTDNLDGFKYHLGNDATVMIRPSGTEPVLRVYAEASTKEEVEKILSEVHGTLFPI